MGTVILVSIGFALIASLMILPTFLVIWANYHNRKTQKLYKNRYYYKLSERFYSS
ncbi:MAG: hypothetical protein Ct9H90mP17_3530 [Actinomycetota bacterium]|nr:MAG: hypothetical protein Ct9H90mP17_3530 [Actinomycetota bacterium]